MNWPERLKRPAIIILALAIIVSVILGALAYMLVIRSPEPDKSNAVVQPTPTPTPTPTATSAATTPTQGAPTPTPTFPPPQQSAQILGVEGSVGTAFTGITWLRLGHPSCGWGDLRGDKLKKTIANYHKDGIRILLTICQGKNDANLYNIELLEDAAQGGADAVQCGNEQMKRDAAVSFLYIPPENFAKFYSLCEKAIHAVRPEVPVLLGSLDPHVGGIDYLPLVDQARYLDQMQTAMNTTVQPGGNWEWRKQTLGLIDSWHNGYPNASVNSLRGLFQFWATQFRVDLNKGELGKHIWVVEGTGCFRGCGLDHTNNAQVSIAHILTLITDVQTSMQYQIPFFYFSGKDFNDQGIYWPIGILDPGGKPKPIRQDLPMGARTLELSCPSGKVTVQDQLQLLAKLYERCTLPANYYNILVN